MELVKGKLGNKLKEYGACFNFIYCLYLFNFILFTFYIKYEEYVYIIQFYLLFIFTII